MRSYCVSKHRKEFTVHTSHDVTREAERAPVSSDELVEAVEWLHERFGILEDRTAEGDPILDDDITIDLELG